MGVYSFRNMRLYLTEYQAFYFKVTNVSNQSIIEIADMHSAMTTHHE